MSQKEKKYSKEWAEEIRKEFNLWSGRFTDTPYISEKGMVNYKKEFDRILVMKGFAIEFKFKTGKTFNLEEWKTNEKTRHQYRYLCEYAKTASGDAILFVFWKKARVREIQRRWAYVQELGGKKIEFEKMRKEEELLEIFRKWWML
jgi:penicillin-binding protein-related factor A (putative recombinase)